MSTESNPEDPAALCGRLRGSQGQHRPDLNDAWTEEDAKPWPLDRVPDRPPEDV